MRKPPARHTAIIDTVAAYFSSNLKIGALFGRILTRTELPSGTALSFGNQSPTDFSSWFRRDRIRCRPLHLAAGGEPYLE